MTGAPLIFDRPLLLRRVLRAAPAAASHDFLAVRAADDLVERLAVVRRSFPRSLCLGATAEMLAGRLAAIPSVGEVTAAPPSPGLLRAWSGSAIAVDEEALPFAPESLDLIASVLTLQLVNDLPGALAQIRRALQPDGLFLAALLGRETLRELREAWLIAEDETTGGASPRVAPFADVRDCGALLQRAGFALPVADSDIVTVRYATPLALMQDVKAMGASNALVERSRTPVTCRLLRRAAEVYAERFSDADGRVRATFELITMTGWAPHEGQQKPLLPGSAKTRLADALGVKEQPTGDKPPKR